MNHTSRVPEEERTLVTDGRGSGLSRSLWRDQKSVVCMRNIIGKFT